MGLQKRFRFFTVRPSTIEREAAQLSGESSKVESKLSTRRPLGLAPVL